MLPICLYFTTKTNKLQWKKILLSVPLTWYLVVNFENKNSLSGWNIIALGAFLTFFHAVKKV